MASQVYGAGTQGGGGASTFYDSADSPSRLANYILRFVALATAFIAAIVMGVAKETRTIKTATGGAMDVQFKAAGASQFE